MLMIKYVFGDTYHASILYDSDDNIFHDIRIVSWTYGCIEDHIYPFLGYERDFTNNLVESLIK